MPPPAPPIQPGRRPSGDLPLHRPPPALCADSPATRHPTVARARHLLPVDRPAARCPSFTPLAVARAADRPRIARSDRPRCPLPSGSAARCPPARARAPGACCWPARARAPPIYRPSLPALLPAAARGPPDRPAALPSTRPRPTCPRGPRRPSTSLYRPYARPARPHARARLPGPAHSLTRPRTARAAHARPPVRPRCPRGLPCPTADARSTSRPPAADRPRPSARARPTRPRTARPRRPARAAHLPGDRPFFARPPARTARCPADLPPPALFPHPPDPPAIAPRYLPALRSTGRSARCPRPTVARWPASSSLCSAARLPLLLTLCSARIPARSDFTVLL